MSWKYTTIERYRTVQGITDQLNTLIDTYNALLVEVSMSAGCSDDQDFKDLYKHVVLLGDDIQDMYAVMTSIRKPYVGKTIVVDLPRKERRN